MTVGKVKLVFSEIESRLGSVSVFEKASILCDWLYERLVHQVPVDQYFKYAFYEKNRRGKAKFIAGKKAREFFRTCNDAEARKVFNDKALFAKIYREYVGRDILDMMNTSFEVFEQFTKKHNQMFIKPTDGHFGLGVSVVDCGKGVDIKKLYSSWAGKHVMAEELVIQHPDMASFNDTSVNTLRLVTFVHPDGTASVMPGALIRIGRKGGIADNFHHGGVGAQIDVQTGVVITSGIDQAARRWIRHPDSGKFIVGFQVPLWDKVCKTVKEAALLNPKVRCVGWDVVVTNDERVVLIEGNGWPDPDLFQMSDGIGRWSLFEQYLEEVKKANCS